MKYILFSVLFFLVFAACEQKNKVENTLNDEQSQLIVEFLKDFPDSTQLSIALINNSEVSFHGIEYVNKTVEFIDNKDKLFEIGSISKIFTATLLADLIVEGKVALDDTIGNYLPFQLKDDVKITFKQLANHTSGLPRLPPNLDITITPQNPYKDYDEGMLLNYLTNDLKITTTPGEKYEYSNLGSGLLGYVITVIDNKSYEDLLREKIFSTYGMPNTTINKNLIKNDLVPGRNPQGKKTSNWDMGVLTPAGGILSSTQDMSKFALAQFDENNKEMQLSRIPTTEFRQNLFVGLGWHILDTGSGTEKYWHSGGTGGYSSYILLDTDKKNGVIFLSNISAFNQNSSKIEPLCFNLLNSL